MLAVQSAVSGLMSCAGTDHGPVKPTTKLTVLECRDHSISRTATRSTDTEFCVVHVVTG